MKTLLHACCGPCSLEPTRLLLEEGHDITVYYANSNIDPQPEYAHRLAELRRHAASIEVGVIEGPYDPAAWERGVGALGDRLAERPQPQAERPTCVSELLDDENRQKRCRACYRLRLAETARVAAAQGFDAVSTTLSVSPYQFTQVIREELERAAAQAGVRADFRDFRPFYDEATRRSREAGMYRQDYCGCRFSVEEGKRTRAFLKQQRAAQKAERAAARQQQERAEGQARAQKEAERRAYADAQARKRAVLKALRAQKEASAVAPAAAGRKEHA
ncbi:epoxyqueuosine reductase QueH [Eggerthellaceae bacterium zg-1084]|uniref:Epoxyqueuosine reductase QueH n=1 Tax=Berryella wangjianweii TaxID=2734634 RepID=A0A6M8J1G4_9ACTN|nr:epoxyqueuosine reductase QueH [Berryella wangjianweii]NPD31101.1 epoxyqueuosine reductase QueH [Berryella wangjianweii]NPD31963.1 epoxyqueuosine reductase QueH [Eggerthellaceae bacterium zg-997]QKF07447.1 epoxyqueuosine reductase QueH [Berryella wangjianweii]